MSKTGRSKALTNKQINQRIDDFGPVYGPLRDIKKLLEGITALVRTYEITGQCPEVSERLHTYFRALNCEIGDLRRKEAEYYKLQGRDARLSHDGGHPWGLSWTNWPTDNTG